MIKVEDIQQYGKEQLETVVASATTVQHGLQAIASAYGDYTKKSYEDTKSFVEKLSGVKSIDKALEVQTEFAKSAYESFVPSRRRSRPCTPISPSRHTSRSKVWSRSSPRRRPSKLQRCFRKSKARPLRPGFFLLSDRQPLPCTAAVTSLV